VRSITTPTITTINGAAISANQKDVPRSTIEYARYPASVMKLPCAMFMVPVKFMISESPTATMA